MIRLIFFNFPFILDRINKESNVPYVKDAIFNPIITNASLGLINIKAMQVSSIVQNIAITLEVFNDLKAGNQSLTVEEVSEFMDELNVDIATERTPATTIPLKPIGKKLIITYDISLSFSKTTPFVAK
tara:strand:- start:110 stop:493 length:384 start_codon:yes stop_codon:yes gene_type:complete